MVFYHFFRSFYEGGRCVGKIAVFFVDGSYFSFCQRGVKLKKEDTWLRRRQLYKAVRDEGDAQAFSDEMVRGDELVEEKAYLWREAVGFADFHGMPIGDGLRPQKDKWLVGKEGERDFRTAG